LNLLDAEVLAQTAQHGGACGVGAEFDPGAAGGLHHVQKFAADMGRIDVGTPLDPDPVSEERTADGQGMFHRKIELVVGYEQRLDAQRRQPFDLIANRLRGAHPHRSPLDQGVGAVDTIEGAPSFCLQVSHAAAAQIAAAVKMGTCREG
jgi:hypothetical protein